MDTKTYNTIIDSLLQGVDWGRVGVRLVKDYPATFAAIVESMAIDPEYMVIASHLQGERILEAIKTFRNMSGWGLKESKDVIDRAVHDLRVYGLMPGAPGSLNRAYNDEEIGHVSRIIKAYKNVQHD